tara:strand:+ start:181 stop:945 length:765 start_codon:yes stop_codon:yes gene_type:complete
LNKIDLYIFSHLDDEFGIFHQLKQSLLSDRETLIIYTTSSSKDENVNEIRLQESINSLTMLGATRNQIILLGKELKVPDLRIIDRIDYIYSYLKDFFEERRNDHIVVFTHSYEGGHPDHDALNLIVRDIKYKNNFVFKILSFPLYHGEGMPWIFYRVMHFQDKKDKWFSSSIPLSKRFFYIRLLFNYKSQVKTLIGIAPFYILKMLFLGEQLLKEEKIFLGKLPHKGRTLYDKRNMYSQLDFQEYVIKKLQNIS